MLIHEKFLRTVCSLDLSERMATLPLRSAMMCQPRWQMRVTRHINLSFMSNLDGGHEDRSRATPCRACLYRLGNHSQSVSGAFAFAFLASDATCSVERAKKATCIYSYSS